MKNNKYGKKKIFTIAMFSKLIGILGQGEEVEMVDCNQFLKSAEDKPT